MLQAVAAAAKPSGKSPTQKEDRADWTSALPVMLAAWPVKPVTEPAAAPERGTSPITGARTELAVPAPAGIQEQVRVAAAAPKGETLISGAPAERTVPAPAVIQEQVQVAAAAPERGTSPITGARTELAVPAPAVIQEQVRVAAAAPKRETSLITGARAERAVPAPAVIQEQVRVAAAAPKWGTLLISGARAERAVPAPAAIQEQVRVAARAPLLPLPVTAPFGQQASPAAAIKPEPPVDPAPELHRATPKKPEPQPELRPPTVLPHLLPELPLIPAPLAPIVTSAPAPHTPSAPAPSSGPVSHTVAALRTAVPGKPAPPPAETPLPVFELRLEPRPGATERTVPLPAPTEAAAAPALIPAAKPQASPAGDIEPASHRPKIDLSENVERGPCAAVSGAAASEEPPAPAPAIRTMPAAETLAAAPAPRAYAALAPPSLERPPEALKPAGPTRDPSTAIRLDATIVEPSKKLEAEIGQSFGRSAGGEVWSPPPRSTPAAPAPQAPATAAEPGAHAPISIEKAALDNHAGAPKLELLIRAENFGRVALRLVERAGVIEVAVRSSSQPLRALLADSLPSLVDRLSDRGWDVAGAARGGEPGFAWGSGGWWTASDQDRRGGSERQPQQRSRRPSRTGEAVSFTLQPSAKGLP